MNIFMILCDELRADALGFMGNPIVKTPSLDALSADSVTFTNSCCNTPMCVPSRLSFATGRHAQSHGALDNMLAPLEDEVSLYSILRDAGYRTVNHGKWHGNIRPSDFGVDVSRDGLEDCSGDERSVTCFGVSDPELRKSAEYKRNFGEISLIIHGKRPTSADDTLDSVVTRNYLEELEHYAAGQGAGGQTPGPIFARLSLMDPHTPYFPSEPYASMYQPEDVDLPESWNEDLSAKPPLHRYFHQARGFDRLNEEDFRKSRTSYYGLVSHVDDRIGKVLRRLKNLGLYDDSLILFTSDHGSMLGEHGFIEKWGHMYEPVMRTPLMIKLPRGEAAGLRLESFVESIDLMPTILDLCSLDCPENVQGKSILPYVRGDSGSHKEEVHGQYFCGSLQNTPALMIRDKRWKLTWYPEGHALEENLLIDHPLRMTGFFDIDEVFGELYDLESDPGETRNLFHDPDYAEVKDMYLEKLRKWQNGLDGQVEPGIHRAPTKLGYYELLQGKNLSTAETALHRSGAVSRLERR